MDSTSVFTNPATRSAEQAGAYTRAVLELVGDRDPLAVLEGTGAALRAALREIGPERSTLPEAPGKWSVRQVLQHLADSELVWGYRLRMALAHDRPRISGYDQDRWAERLGYAGVEAEQALADFTALREMNLRLLRRASEDDLRRAVVHEERGEESVGHMIRLYAGHDLLHLRQIGRIGAAVAEPPA